MQIDSIHPADFSFLEYNNLRARYSEVVVFGGINFKYKTQEKGEGLVRELNKARSRSEAIVTTGEGTGKETPIKNLKKIKKIIENFPLISGAGVNSENVYETSLVADGIIIGSYLKDGNTHNKIIKEKCREIREKFY